MKTNITIFPIFIVAIILSACSFGLSSSQVGLDDSAWILTEINNDTTIIGNSPTLEFEGDMVSGNASCNIYSGSYQVEGVGRQ